MRTYFLVALFAAAQCTSIIPARAQPTRLDTAFLRHVPADANQVIRINLPHVLTQLNWLDFTHAVAQFCPQTPGITFNVDSIKRPKDIGLNPRKPVIISTGFNPDNSGYTSIIINLTDSGQFISWLQKFFPTLHAKTINGTRTAAMLDRKSVV